MPNNNNLPDPPPGYASWRAAFASNADFLSRHKGNYNPEKMMLEFVPPLKWRYSSQNTLPIGSEDSKLMEIPYWQVADYAAREQAEYDVTHPPLTLSQQVSLLRSLTVPNSDPLDPLIKDWLDLQIKAARKAESTARN